MVVAVDDPCFFLEVWAGLVVDAVAGGVGAASAVALLPLAFLLFGVADVEAVLAGIVPDVLSVVAAAVVPVGEVAPAAVVSWCLR